MRRSLRESGAAVGERLFRGRSPAGLNAADDGRLPAPGTAGSVRRRGGSCRLARASLAVLAGVLILAASGCRQQDDNAGGTETGVGSSPAGGGHRVPVEVVNAGRNSILVFVRVWIGREGPFSFVLDTGASRTVISSELVRELGLDERGGVNRPANGEAMLVEVESWRVGDVALPPATAVSMDLPSEFPGPEIQGLLGSDMLSRFDYMLLDYQEGDLQLVPESSSGSG